MNFLTETHTLTGPCGYLGTIRAFDLWELRKSREACIEGVANIASLSYGNEAAKNPEALFKSIVDRGHLSCLEFVPFPEMGDYADDFKPCLPRDSLRCAPDMINPERCNPKFYWGESAIKEQDEWYPATAFLVESPILTIRQWFRHRAFSYLEMSRRYVKGSKVPFEFYGADNAKEREAAHYAESIALYDELCSWGEPPERARRVIPVGAFSRFWAGGYNHDWKDSFTRLRSEKHAQTEIRLFSEFIQDIVK